MSGTELSNLIDEKLGSRPSPGSIYPLLSDLEENGLVSAKKEGKKKRYHLTEEGRKASKKIEEKRDEILKSVRGALGVFDTVFDEDVEPIMRRIKDAKEEDFPPFPELVKIHNLIASAELEGKGKEVRAELRKTLQNLEELVKKDEE